MNTYLPTDTLDFNSPFLEDYLQHEIDAGAPAVHVEEKIDQNIKVNKSEVVYYHNSLWDVASDAALTAIIASQ